MRPDFSFQEMHIFCLPAEIDTAERNNSILLSMASLPVCSACGVTFGGEGRAGSTASTNVRARPASSTPRGAAGPAQIRPSFRQSMVLAFSASGASPRQREASWAGLLPPEMQMIILEQLPLTPEYGSIAGVGGTIGKGSGTGPGQFKSVGSMYQVSFGIEFDEDDGMYQVSFGPDSTVWAVDGDGHRVHHFKQNGELIKTIGMGSASDRPGAFSMPTGVAVSHLGSSVFIGEWGNHRISEFNQSDGAFVRVLDTPGLVHPYGMCLSPDETTLAVACANHDCIMLFRVDGSEAPRAIEGEEEEEDGQFNTPIDVRFTQDGQQLVVADCDNHRVQVLALDGSFVRIIPLGTYAHAVAMDAAGNIIAATKKHVKVFSPEGTLLHDKLGGLVMGQAASSGLAIDPCSGRIAVGGRDVGKVHLL